MRGKGLLLVEPDTAELAGAADVLGQPGHQLVPGAVGVVLLLLSAFAMGIGQQQQVLLWFVASLFFFFMGFNIFEPIFPSLVTRTTTAETKGTAMGVYNFAQFFGHFAGATLAGALYINHFYIFILLILLAEFWFFYLTLSFTNPKLKY